METDRHVRRQLLHGLLRLVPLPQPDRAWQGACFWSHRAQIRVTVTSVDVSTIGLGALPVALSAVTHGIGAPAPGWTGATRPACTTV